MSRRREDIDPHVDYRKANYAMAVLLHFAGQARELPDPLQFDLKPVESDDVFALIEEAIANCGGDVLPDSSSHS